MAAIQRSEFALALNQIASERGVDPQVVIDTIKGAILAAYKKDNPSLTEESEEDDSLYSVDLNDNTGETRILKEGKDITPPGFGRIAAQTAKQVLLQKIREKEKDAVISEYSKRTKTVVNGMILRFAGPNIIVDIGKAEAIMEASDKIPNEQYFPNKKMVVYIREIDEEKRDILVSRTDPGLIEGLLKREVPEVNSGSVVVKRVVREPGNRAKIAVYSDQSGIDPVGSCVGQKGVRIQAVIDAIDGLEKIDVIQWNADPVRYITNALSPAKDLIVTIDEKTKRATVSAPNSELPLVIGRDGQNVRLASKLTEFEIEVVGREEEAAKEEKKVEKKEKEAEVSKETKEDVETPEAEVAEPEAKPEATEEVAAPASEESNKENEPQEAENPTENTEAVLTGEVINDTPAEESTQAQAPEAAEPVSNAEATEEVVAENTEEEDKPSQDKSE